MLVGCCWCASHFLSGRVCAAPMVVLQYPGGGGWELCTCVLKMAPVPAELGGGVSDHSLLRNLGVRKRLRHGVLVDVPYRGAGRHEAWSRLNHSSPDNTIRYSRFTAGLIVLRVGHEGALCHAGVRAFTLW